MALTLQNNTIITPPRLRETMRWKDMRIGLFGGSFNPVHEGHLHIARLARVKFDLDFIWWLITPQNPLKDSKHTRPYIERYNKVDNLLKGFPRQIPTHLETEIKGNYSFETIFTLKQYFPQTQFVWICGMDNAYVFHQWDRWEDIINTIPIAFIARPPATDLVHACPLRMKTNIIHKYKTIGRNTDLTKPTIYWLSGSKMLDISSTEIRNNKIKTNT